MTKEKKELLDRTFRAFVEVGLSGENVGILDDLVAKDIVGFGTTIDEKIFGVSEMKDLLFRQKEQSAGMEMNWKINILDIHISSEENTAIFTSEVMLYITVDGNPIDMYIRFSVVLDYVQDKWLVVHWHGSKPEHVESEKDTWGVQTWKEKAEELEKQVAERTAELLEKNHELAIEAALERVRAVAMGMKKPEDMLDVCRVIAAQLEQFGVKHIRNVQTVIINESIGQYICYQFFPTYDQTVIEDTQYHKSPVEHEMVKQMLACCDGHFIGSLLGEELNAFREHRKEENQFPDRLLDETSEISYAFLSIGEGGLGLSLYQPMNENVLMLFKRFHQVFSLAYQRFRDIQKAEAQAREAQIEAALERVRAKTMAMHSSNDVSMATETLFTELDKLGIQNLRGGIAIISPDQKQEVWSVNHLPEGNTLRAIGTFDMRLHPYWQQLYDAFEKQAEFLYYRLAGIDKENYIALLNKTPHYLDHPITALPDVHIQSYLFGEGAIWTNSLQPHSVDEKQIMKKFVSVFSLTFRRYLDLQKAEAQTREAQIEAALERVRAKTMAMHKSEQLPETAQVLFEQFAELGKIPDRIAIGIIKEDLQVIEWWVTDQTGSQLARHFDASILEPTIAPYFAAWKEGKDSIMVDLSGESLKEWVAYVRDVVKMPIDDSNMRGRRVHHGAFFSQGLLLISAHEPMSDETMQLLVRFAKVFNQTYTRFLDLQKAEAQAREAQIEAALERIRARALAMHQSEEFTDVAKVMREQMGNLGQPELETSAVHLYDEDADSIFSWRAFRLSSHSEGNITYGFFKIPKTSCAIAREFIKKFNSEASDYTIEVSGEKQTEWYKILLKLAPEVEDAMKKSGVTKEKRYYHFSKFTGGALLMVSSKEPSADAVKLQKRAAQVFDLAYRRFKDLQKAEAQAREAQIEASLERVRSKTMAMHNSNDVGHTVVTMFDELIKLGAEANRCGIIIIDETKHMEVWTAGRGMDGGVKLITGKLDMTIHPLLEYVHEAWKSKQDMFEYRMIGDDLISYYRAINDSKYYPTQFDLEALPAQQSHTDFFFPEGALFAFSPEPIVAENAIIFKRFAGVFGQTYRRYLDLQNAEKQAREAQIEAALERVRSKAMAMRTSEDIAETTAASFDELKKLGIFSFRSGVGILTKGSSIARVFADARSTGGEVKALTTIRNMDEHPALIKQYEAWEQQQDYELTLSGDELISYYSHSFFQASEIVVQESEAVKQECGYYFAFPDGLFYSWSYQPYTESEKNILKRFRNIIALTFRRFLDLQRAEASAVEAIRQAALDRVRAEIASMRTTEDLQRITPLIWRELTALNVPFFRCGIFIVDEKIETIHFYLSTPEGKPLAVLHQKFDSSDVVKNATDYWKFQKVYTTHWDKEQFVSFTKSMIEQGQIQTAKNYQGGDEPPESLTLQFIPFAQGMLYVGSAEPLTELQIEVVQALALAFSTAYARYEDFNKLEAAKNEVDKTLQELKMAQDQLVQAEKLASLGQLTAGIAHEIKNPLNFINNFSDVSVELIDEVLSELHQPPTPELKDEMVEILNSVKSNLHIIHQHGSRADGIVKSMLMHSRSSTGRKEPTDLNAMIRENVNLAFHAMRATKDPIVLETELQLDDMAGEVPLIIEDFSRVILNLCNNAFDAMREKSSKYYADGTKDHKPGYEGVAGERMEKYSPKLSVRTKRVGSRVLIEVEDNGTGISAAIRDKVLQPFFTTKKGTQGTGLGLSITNDIIKAHGGTLEIETEPGKFTKFIITIP